MHMLVTIHATSTVPDGMESVDKLTSAVFTVIAASCLNIIGVAKKIKEKMPKGLLTV